MGMGLGEDWRGVAATGGREGGGGGSSSSSGGVVVAVVRSSSNSGRSGGNSVVCLLLLYDGGLGVGRVLLLWLLLWAMLLLLLLVIVAVVMIGGVARWWVGVCGGVLDAGETGDAGDAGGLPMVTVVTVMTEVGRGRGGHVEVGVVESNVINQFVQHLIQHHAALTEPHQHQRKLKADPGGQSQLPLEVSLLYGVQQEQLDVGHGTVASAVGGDAHDGGLHEVVEAAEEVAQHATGPHDPDCRVGELVLEEGQGVLQTPALPLAYLLELGLHLHPEVLRVPLEEEDVLYWTWRAVVEQ